MLSMRDSLHICMLANQRLGCWVLVLSMSDSVRSCLLLDKHFLAAAAAVLWCEWRRGWDVV